MLTESSAWLAYWQPWMAELCTKATEGAAWCWAKHSGWAGTAAGGLCRDSASSGRFCKDHPVPSQPPARRCQAPIESHGKGILQRFMYHSNSMLEMETLCSALAVCIFTGLVITFAYNSGVSHLVWFHFTMELFHELTELGRSLWKLFFSMKWKW